MDEYTKYLATKVVNEDQIINYRQLSRALKVHTHTAKRMLYEFHAKQTKRKPGSVHATYLISGILQAQSLTSQITHDRTSLQDGDVPMESSPFPSSMVEPYPNLSFESESDLELDEEAVHTTTVRLVKEEELHKVKAEFEDIRLLFVYSLGPCPLKDFALLRQCNRDMVKESFWTADPLNTYPNLGLIVNAGVRRRSGKRPVPPVASVVTMVKKEPAQIARLVSNVPQASTLAQDSTTIRSTKPSVPRRQSSDLFKSFAKTQPPKLKTTDSNATTDSMGHSPSDHSGDAPMQDMSEDEASDIDEALLEAEAQKAEASKKARMDKEDKLREMMDDMDDNEDEEMKDADLEEPSDEADATAVVMDKPGEEGEEGGIDQVTVSNGRRRGRRRVLKKRTFQDDDGYLVTKEELAWESFSEDEPAAKKPKITAAPMKAAKKIGPASKGQGNLMAFFKKK